MMANERKAYLIGGGIAALAAAAFLIRDGGLAGANITILEAAPVFGGSLDACEMPAGGYSMRGGRMLTSDNYECTWELFRSIPSLSRPDTSVYDETMAFNAIEHSHAQARLVNRQRARVPVEFLVVLARVLLGARALAAAYDLARSDPGSHRLSGQSARTGGRAADTPPPAGCAAGRLRACG